MANHTDSIDQAILRFVGYGNLSAPFWFLGMEEGTGGSRSLADDLEVRRRFDTVMDLAIAHDSDHLDRPLDSIARLPSSWLNIARLVRGLEDADDHNWLDLEAAKGYVTTRLGREHGQTLLLELMPLPKPSTASWPREFVPWFATQAEYRSSIRPHRQEMIESLIKKHQPRLVLCYGKANWREFESMCDRAERFEPVGRSGRIAIAERGPTTFVLTNFLGNGQFSLEDLRELRDHLISQW